MPRVYPCRGATSTKAHQYRGPIFAQCPSISKAHEGPTIPRAHSSGEPMPAQGTSIPRAHEVHFHAQRPTMPRVNPSSGLSIPRAHQAHPCLGPIHAEAPSLTTMGAIHA